MQYKLIVRTNESELSESVNEHLRLGWELYGSPCCSIASDVMPIYKFCQAIIRKEE